MSTRRFSVMMGAALAAFVSQAALAGCAARRAQQPADTSGPDVAVVPSPAAMANALQRAAQRALDQHKAEQSGQNADYIPALAAVNPGLFGVAIANVHGQVVEVGDARHPFAIESVSKIFTLARVLEDLGARAVADHIGVNQAGLSPSSVMKIELNLGKSPGLNPLVNAGAIAAVSWVKADSAAQRWTRIIGTLNAFAERQLELDEVLYRAASTTFQQDKDIIYVLADDKVIAGDPDEALDLYTRQCSVLVSARDLAVMGSTFANGGVHPQSKRRILSEANAARVLALMGTTGLYETTGKWMYDVGVPAKSGVGGGIVAVIPGRFAIAAFSPPLDAAGNSVRGQLAIADIVAEVGGNLYGARPHDQSYERGALE